MLEQEALPPDQVQRQERVRVARKARGKVLLALIAAASLIAASVYFSAGRAPEAGPEPADVEAPGDEGVSAVIGVTGDDGRLDSVVLLAASSGYSPRAVLFPPALLVHVPGFGDRELADVTALGGAQLLALTVTNLLGVRVDAVVIHNTDTLSTVLVSPLEVTLHAPLVVESDDAEQIAVAQGAASREPEVLIRLLVEQGTSDQLAWLVRQGAVWAAMLEGASSDGSIAGRLVAPAASGRDAAGQAFNLAAQDPETIVTPIPSERIESVGGGLERYGFGGIGVGAYVEASFPYLALVNEPRIRVQLLNGNGGIGSTRPVARAVILEGYRLVATDNADRSDYLETQIIAQGREHQEHAVAMQRFLGVGEVVLNLRQPSGVVDLVIIVGSDIPAEG